MTHHRLLCLAVLLGCSSGHPDSGHRVSQTMSAPHGIVVSASRSASEAGRDILAQGGNAIDAAVATGFALAVTYPEAGNIGGGGFMVIRFPDGRATTIDFRETAPTGTTPMLFTDANGHYSARLHHGSHRAVGVPGTVAGFALAHEKYGRAPWRRVVEPAVRLAREGFVVTPALSASLADAVRHQFAPYPASIAAFTRDGRSYAAGDTLRQPDLARTLSGIRDRGRAGFYDGPTARLIAEEMRRGEGLITERDLAGYAARERAPILGRYRGYDITAMPPPSAGGVALVEMLNILEAFPLRTMQHDSPQYVHLIAEAMRRGFLDRARYLGDPDFSGQPIERLTSKAYAQQEARTIMAARASVSSPSQVAETHESSQTTHYSVVDSAGTAVSVTFTLERGYGLGAVVPGAGFLLNNEMGDFNGQPGVTDASGSIGTPANLAMPGKRMLSSMTPTIISKDGKLVAVVGSPGGRTIISTVLQVILNQVDLGMPLRAAIDASRFHHQWLPDVIDVERGGLPAATVDALERMGYHIRGGDDQGAAHSIRVDERTGARIAVADRRDPDSAPAGY